MALPSLWPSRRAGSELLPGREIWEPFGSLRRSLQFWQDSASLAHRPLHTQPLTPRR